MTWVKQVTLSRRNKTTNHPISVKNQVYICYHLILDFQLYICSHFDLIQISYILGLILTILLLHLSCATPKGNPILTEEQKKILGITMPRPTTRPFRSTTDISLSTYEDVDYQLLPTSSMKTPQNHNDTSKLSYQTTWFSGTGIPAICRLHNASDKVDKPIEVIPGDVMVTLITRDVPSALFVVNRIREANLLSGHFKLGMLEILNRNIILWFRIHFIISLKINTFDSTIV